MVILKAANTNLEETELVRCVWRSKNEGADISDVRIIVSHGQRLESEPNK